MNFTAPLLPQQVLDLLLRWEEEGRVCSAEDLCRDQPELLSQVREAMERLRRFSDWDNDLTAPSLPDDPVGEVQLPARYQLGARIGEGGMGVIWRVTDRQLQRDLAIKIPSRSAGRANGEGYQRFLWEAQITARLQHPGVVPIH